MYGLTKIGNLIPKSAAQVSCSRLGIGLEKLDRNLYDPTPCYEPMAELGVKWVRIQSGWCRTEKTPGVYDFTWLDAIVDNIIARHMTPWICLCYGNELYTKEANNAYGAVGRPPIFTEEEKAAWHRYVAACANHFKGRVRHYEVWNEPDTDSCWRHGVSGTEYGLFTIATAKAVREGNPDAIIFGGSMNKQDLRFVYDMMETGAGDHIEYYTYHRYRHAIENGLPQFLEGLRGVLDQYNPAIKIIQGEVDAPACYSGRGAMRYGCWTERKQAKFLLRKMMIDLTTEAAFTSYFSTADMYENLYTDEGTMTKDYYGFFGVLGEAFDGEKPTGKYYKRPSFFALQNLCSVMYGQPKKTALPISFDSSWTRLTGQNDEKGELEGSGLFTCGFTLEDGTKAFTYWKTTNYMTTDFEGTVSLKAYGLGEHVRLVDLYDGSVYTIDPEYLECEGGVLAMNHIPVRDYPLLLVFGDTVG